MDYYSTGRTNYFKVKDLQAFKDWVSFVIGGTLIEKNGLVGFIKDNGIPSFKVVKDKEVNLDFTKELKSHLVKGQVAIYMESGSEGHRYITGMSVAVTPGKKPVFIDIDDIYKNAARKFGVYFTDLISATY